MPRTVSDNRSEKCLDVSRKGRGGEKVKMGAGIAQWLEHRTRD